MNTVQDFIFFSKRNTCSAEPSECPTTTCSKNFGVRKQWTVGQTLPPPPSTYLYKPGSRSSIIEERSRPDGLLLSAAGVGGAVRGGAAPPATCRPRRDRTGGDVVPFWTETDLKVDLPTSASRPRPQGRAQGRPPTPTSASRRLDVDLSEGREGRVDVWKGREAGRAGGREFGRSGGREGGRIYFVAGSRSKERKGGGRRVAESRHARVGARARFVSQLATSTWRNRRPAPTYWYLSMRMGLGSSYARLKCRHWA